MAENGLKFDSIRWGNETQGNQRCVRGGPSAFKGGDEGGNYLGTLDLDVEPMGGRWGGGPIALG